MLKHRLTDLLDFPRIQPLLDSLSAALNLPVSIIGDDGTIYAAAGWQDLCAKFHRSHPPTEKLCIESNCRISRRITGTKGSTTYRCPLGLVDSATPIIAEGEHLGTVFAGQTFLEEPDLDGFRAQARRYGFDETSYIDAVKKIPVVPVRTLEAHLAFISRFTEMLAEMGLNHAREREAEQRYWKEAREATVELLRLCGDAADLDDLMRKLVLYFQQLTGCEAVGVRLRRGDDFPYYETRGFSADFVLAENTLCRVDAEGDIVRDGTGHPALDCMCGNILCGRVDPSKPFFSPGGSFWANNTTRLLATTTEGDRQAKTRNRCNGEGYESVALVPMRAQGRTFGLFQFNDRREGRFTPEKIALLEELVTYVAIALAKQLSDQETRESETRYRDLFDHMLEGFAYCRMIFEDGVARDFIYLAVNEAFEKLTGLRNVVGKRVTDVIPGLRETDPGLIDIYGKVAATGIPGKFEIFVAALKMWFSVSVYCPKKGFFVAVFDVITERKKTEEALKSLNETLERQVAERTAALAASNRELEAFSYSVSHDLRAPLRAIDGFGQALSEDCGDRLDDAGKDYLRRIRAATRRMGTLIDDMLGLSRISRADLRPETVSLSALAEEIVAEHREAEPGRPVDVAVEPGLSARGDRRLIRIAVQNLLDNAWKFTSRTPGASVAFGRRVAGGETEYYVRDNGVGFDMAYADKLFAAFQRLHSADDFPGTGIGLATVRRIITRHGGRIRVESAPGRGTAFFFTLPG